MDFCMTLRLFSKYILATLLSVPLIVHADSWMNYIVQKGESLSQILQRASIIPVYGEKGSIAESLKLNPKLRKHGGNRIYPGQKLLLPKKIETEVAVIPVILPAETPHVTRIPTIDTSDDAQALVSVFVGVDFFRIDGDDKTTSKSATILSEASPNIGLGFNLLWNELTTFSLNLKMTQYKLQDLDDGQGFDKTSGQKFDLYLRMMKQVSEKWTLGAGVAFEEDLFFHAKSASQLNVDKVLITKPGVYGRYVAYAKRNANIGLDGKLGLNLGAKSNDYKIKNGMNAGVGTYFKYHSKLLDENYRSLEAKVFYSVDDQDTDETTRKLTNLSFMIVYDWRLNW